MNKFKVNYITSKEYFNQKELQNQEDTRDFYIDISEKNRRTRQSARRELKNIKMIENVKKGLKKGLFNIVGIIIVMSVYLLMNFMVEVVTKIIV